MLANTSFRTELNFPEQQPKIGYNKKVLLLGSCFVENMSIQMDAELYPNICNPFGILYNPASIAHSLELLLKKCTFKPEELSFENELFFSFKHSSIFSSSNENEVLTKINQTFIEGKNALENASHLIITFGTSWVYHHIESDKLVSNCHKLPAKQFKRYTLTSEEIIGTWLDIIEQIQKKHPNLQLIFTLSPIRHLKDGLIENSLSKATLLYSIHQICTKTNHTTYFPSYEIMMDDLRDYRFYSDDMVHPTKVAISYIWDKFFDSFFDRNEKILNKRIKKLMKASLHRPFRIADPQHQSFIIRAIQEANKIKDEYPHIHLSPLIKNFETQLIQK